MMQTAYQLIWKLKTRLGTIGKSVVAGVGHKYSDKDVGVRRQRLLEQEGALGGCGSGMSAPWLSGSYFSRESKRWRYTGPFFS
jgi:hypothetical protein